MAEAGPLPHGDVWASHHVGVGRTAAQVRLHRRLEPVDGRRVGTGRRRVVVGGRGAPSDQPGRGPGGRIGRPCSLRLRDRRVGPVFTPGGRRLLDRGDAAGGLRFLRPRAPGDADPPRRPASDRRRARPQPVLGSERRTGVALAPRTLGLSGPAQIGGRHQRGRAPRRVRHRSRPLGGGLLGDVRRARPGRTSADARVVPLGTLLGADPLLEIVTGLEIGRGLWRGPAEPEWRTWDPTAT